MVNSNIKYPLYVHLTLNYKLYFQLVEDAQSDSQHKEGCNSQFNDGERNLMIAKESREGERGNDKQVVISRHTKLKCKLRDL